MVLSASTLASDEWDVVAEVAVGPCFPACCCSGGILPPTVPPVSLGFGGQDVATLKSQVRVGGAMPDQAAIGLGMPNATAPMYLFLLVF